MTQFDRICEQVYLYMKVKDVTRERKRRREREKNEIFLSTNQSIELTNKIFREQMNSVSLSSFFMMCDHNHLGIERRNTFKIFNFISNINLYTTEKAQR